MIDLELNRRATAGELLHLGTERFDVDYYFDALEDWHDFLANPHTAGLDVDPARLQGSEAALRRGECVLGALETWTASAFRTGSISAAR